MNIVKPDLRITESDRITRIQIALLYQYNSGNCTKQLTRLYTAKLKIYKFFYIQCVQKYEFKIIIKSIMLV
jgi:hypothetical protein